MLIIRQPNQLARPGDPTVGRANLVGFFTILAMATIVCAMPLVLQGNCTQAVGPAGGVARPGARVVGRWSPG